MRAKIFFIALSLTSFMAKAQTGIETILGKIEKNNKSIMSQRQYWEAEKLSYKTGLNPENPKIDYEYLPGRPDGAGTQKDVSITQGIDFPTTYGKRRSVSQEQIKSSDIQFNVFRQEVLLEAKLSCLDYAYRTKLQAELDKRLKDASTLLDAINRKAEQGESNILDLNKIRLLQLEIKNQSELNRSELKRLQHKLDELNGGDALDLSNVTYPTQPSLPAFENLDSLIEANDPVVKAVRQEREVNKEQVGLSRSITLPKFEGGFHRQSILGQTYQGVHVGMTIPLWENNNRVKAEKAKLVHTEYQITEHRTKHYFENKQLFEQYTHWQYTFKEYQDILGSANNDQLLQRAFQAGELSLIEYLMEVRYFYDAIGKSLDAEREMQQSVARLYRFEL
jgi:cobalt-zinc-cadmium efflux system outer membrane protein